MVTRIVRTVVFFGCLLVPCLSFAAVQRDDMAEDAQARTVVEEILKAAKAEADTGSSWYSFHASGLAMDQAVRDVAANMPYIVAMRRGFGESSNLEWGVRLSDALPSQPVAVIQAFARTGTDLSWVCPRMVIEDALSELGQVRLMARSIAALAAFTLVDPREEAVRKECLARNVAALQKRRQPHQAYWPAEPWPVKER